MSDTTFDWPALVEALTRLLRLKTLPIGMKLFSDEAALAAMPGVRRPKARHTLDQIVGQAARLGWTVGITADDLALQQCGAVVGLHPQDEQFQAGAFLTGVWYATPADSAAHQRALTTVPYGRYRALVVSPLARGLLDPPDICLIYATPGQMILLINGLQYRGYRKFEWSAVGETACADSWGRALATGEPSLSIPCYAERRFGGVADDELLLALPPRYLPPLIDGLQQLAANGVRYPIPPFGIQADVRPGLPAHYPVLGRGARPGEKPA
ncbi:MAG: DUF169 domain-containing protein [Chloroflexota bacterium]|nr:DUF169 domain-containing protein [Dehalococcoidia bacterium]MDW8252964.1 DUF169 domain-containing protein [Chloroflexota bacterium]